MVVSAKHQVFISSTYADLVEARQWLFMQTYRLRHIPIGMEGFTASNMPQWEYIQKRVAECDYFVVVAAHRYGSIIPDGSGRSFTEAEYDLAESLGKPVLRFVIRDSAPWPGDGQHRENDSAVRDRLAAFKARLMAANLVAQWSTREDLAAAYSVALTELIHHDPRGGLFPADAHPELAKLGIRHLHGHSNTMDHASILREASPVTVVLNDGYHFIQKYAQELEARVQRGAPTRVLLIHPDSVSLELVARKSNKTVAQQKADILRGVSHLKAIGLRAASPAVLRCLGHEYINSYSASLGESTAIVSLYFTRVRSNELTTMVLSSRADSLHGKYVEDVDQLWRETESRPGSDLFQLVD